MKKLFAALLWGDGMKEDAKRREILTSKPIPLIRTSYHGIEMERVLRDLRAAQKGLVRMTAWIKAGELKVIPEKRTYELMFAIDELERFVDQLEQLRVDSVSKEGGEDKDVT